MIIMIPEIWYEHVFIYVYTHFIECRWNMMKHVHTGGGKKTWSIFLVPPPQSHSFYTTSRCAWILVQLVESLLGWMSVPKPLLGAHRKNSTITFWSSGVVSILSLQSFGSKIEQGVSPSNVKTSLGCLQDNLKYWSKARFSLILPGKKSFKLHLPSWHKSQVGGGNIWIQFS